MSNSIERFSDRVENYVKYRPDYPKSVLNLLTAAMNLKKDSIIADIGSGTGISAKLFLENGNRVFGVEPNRAMRTAAENYLKDYKNFTSVSGTAEKTTLDDESVDFIVAAQAFHWFNQGNARKEFKRILKSAGYVALIWNERQLNSTAFLRDYESLLIEYGTDYDKVRHENITKESLDEFFQSKFRQAVFPNRQRVDFEGLKGRMLSSSYMPSEKNDSYAEMLENLKSLFAEHAESGRIDILYDTKIFYGQI